MIHKNIGTADRVARLLVGVLVFVCIPFVSAVLAKVALLIIGLFMVYQAVMGWCALYALIGKNTCPVQK
jgi:hypothetical protein